MAHYISVLAPGIGWTLLVTGLAVSIAVVLGLPVALLRRSNNVVARALGRSVVELFRSIPSIVLLFIVFYGIGSGAVQVSPLVASVSTLGVIGAVYMAEIYRSAILAVSPGQWEAASVIGLSRWDTLRLIILPQAVRTAIPSMSTVAIGNLKDSAVASTVGVTEITSRAVAETMRSLDGIGTYTMAAVIYILLSLPIAIFARWTHAKLSKRLAR